MSDTHYPPMSLQHYSPMPTWDPFWHPQQTSTGHFGSGDFQLLMAQEPKHGVVASEEKPKGRKPVDPPPVVKLVVSREADPEQLYMNSPYLFMTVMLLNAAGDEELNSDLMIGTLASSVHRLKANDDKETAFFIFGDISVKEAGSYRFRFNLFDLHREENAAIWLGQISSQQFRVHGKGSNYHALGESTFLSRTLSAQGVKIRLRKETNGKKRSLAEMHSQTAHVPTVPHAAYAINAYFPNPYANPQQHQLSLLQAASSPSKRPCYDGTSIGEASSGEFPGGLRLAPTVADHGDSTTASYTHHGLSSHDFGNTMHPAAEPTLHRVSNLTLPYATNPIGLSKSPRASAETAAAAFYYRQTSAAQPQQDAVQPDSRLHRPSIGPGGSADIASVLSANTHHSGGQAVGSAANNKSTLTSATANPGSVYTQETIVRSTSSGNLLSVHAFAENYRPTLSAPNSSTHLRTSKSLGHMQSTPGDNSRQDLHSSLFSFRPD